MKFCNALQSFGTPLTRLIRTTEIITCYAVWYTSRPVTKTPANRYYL